MKSTSIFFIFCLINPTAFAFEAHIANYQISVNGFQAAEEARTLHQLEDGYLYTTNGKTSGLAALIKDYAVAASSVFTLNSQGVSSTNYKIIEKKDNKVIKNYVVNIDALDNSVVSTLTEANPIEKTWLAEKGNIVDPLSVFLAIAFDLKNNPEKTEFSYQIANGKTLAQQYFKKTLNQPIEVIGKTFNTIKVERINNKEDNIEAYFLAEYDYIPVLIKKQKNGINFTDTIIDFKRLEVEPH